MKKIALAAVALVLLPGFAAASCFGTYEPQQAMSCAEGTAPDPETGVCVPVATS